MQTANTWPTVKRKTPRPRRSVKLARRRRQAYQASEQRYQRHLRAYRLIELMGTLIVSLSDDLAECERRLGIRPPQPDLHFHSRRAVKLARRFAPKLPSFGNEDGLPGAEDGLPNEE